MKNTESFLDNYKLEGEQLEILAYPHPTLKKVATEVQDFGPELKELVKNMLYTMYHAPGIGLAAPQIGLSKRLFVMDIDYKREETGPEGKETVELSEFSPRVLINPKFRDAEGEILYEEGCLSVPGMFEEVKRSEHIWVDYQDMDGQPQTLEAQGLLAVCLQHENDHLDGIVFLERLGALKKQLTTKKYLKQRKRLQQEKEQ